MDATDRARASGVSIIERMATIKLVNKLKRRIRAKHLAREQATTVAVIDRTVGLIVPEIAACEALAEDLRGALAAEAGVRRAVEDELNEIKRIRSKTTEDDVIPFDDRKHALDHGEAFPAITSGE